MQLSTLFTIHGKIDWRELSPQVQALGLTADSRQVQSGTVYVAIRGHQGDGHTYLPQAVQAGALAVVVEDVRAVPADYRGAVVEVLDSRISLQRLSQIYYGAPGESLVAVGVTGTNGKTSCTYILEHLLNACGLNCGVIGTIDHHFQGQAWATDLTTPDPITLQQRLREFADLGAKSFVIEASSHALAQNRIDQGFDVTLFTNLSHDHLDYHKDMEDYFLAKAKLFSESMLKESADCLAVVNVDDSYGQRLLKLSPGRRVYAYGKGVAAHLRFAIIKSGLGGTEINLTVGGEYNFMLQSPLIGEHNAYNLVGCLAVVYGLGLDLKHAAQSFQFFPGVPGRMQRLTSQQGVVGFVDYAHTPDALEQAIQSLRPLVKKTGLLITVFGCGGDRDPAKRPVMGELATRLSDFCLITSDNPRTEDPGQIIKEIASGVVDKNATPYSVHLDRGEAIHQACRMAKPGDVILVAGKGHEDYQIIGTTKQFFDDRQVLRAALQSP
jgi:UDP-N-acetylmuramoyl-L-alanyl-D-glutamate--2,6-diaminopimelate ligase